MNISKSSAGGNWTEQLLCRLKSKPFKGTSIVQKTKPKQKNPQHLWAWVSEPKVEHLYCQFQPCSESTGQLNWALRLHKKHKMWQGVLKRPVQYLCNATFSVHWSAVSYSDMQTITLRFFDYPSINPISPLFKLKSGSGKILNVTEDFQRLLISTIKLTAGFVSIMLCYY